MNNGKNRNDTSIYANMLNGDNGIADNTHDTVTMCGNSGGVQHTQKHPRGR